MMTSVEIVTLEELSYAMQERIGLDERQANEDANFIMDLFGFNNRIIDNVLEPEDRQLFYMMEEWGLITTEREETTLYDGRQWRTHYWLFKKDRILGYADNHRERLEEEDKKTVYDELPKDIWSDRD